MRIVILAVLAVTAGESARWLVSYVTDVGLISEEDQAKNRTQLQSKAGGLLGGRPEFQVSSRAVMDSPILGHGSWAKDPKYIEMLHDMEIEGGMPENKGEFEAGVGYGTIPAHSHIMGAWVWAGILGAVFWAYILVLAVKSTIRVATLLPPLAPLYAYILIELLWSIPFSPFGASKRFLDAFAIVILSDLLVDIRPAGVLEWTRKRQRRPGAFRDRNPIPTPNAPRWLSRMN